jgi:hypothetical protein
MSVLLTFPDTAYRRRMHARRPRRSKNGTPEERAAKRAAKVAAVIEFTRRDNTTTTEPREAAS